MRALGTVGVIVILVGAAGPAGAAAPKSIGTLVIEDLSPQPSPIFTFAVSAANSAGTGGAGAGKLVISKFALTKPVDALSPKLLHQLANGETVPQAQIELQAAKGVRPAAVTIIVYDVHITTDAVSDGGETVEMAFGKIREIAHTADGDVETCWDLTQNLGC